MFCKNKLHVGDIRKQKTTPTVFLTTFAAVMKTIQSYIVCILCCIALPVNGQTLRNPFDFPILLSGNFGELRANHFHAGIDFKTQGTEGKPVHAVEKGYVSRISVSPGGYGNGLYLTHPDGTTTVYGHLQQFSTKIAAYVKAQQYVQERFAVNLTLTPDEIPVGKGEVVALSGNTGSSAGPHLHFEIRNTETEKVLDPLPCFQASVTDTRPPVIQGIRIYPQEGEGMVNGSNRNVEIKTPALKGNKATTPARNIEAWGKIGFAVKAFDYMDQTSNIYGVKEITLTADSQMIFQSRIDSFSFDESRYINSFIDYGEWADRRSFYMKSFVEPGNHLSFLDSRNRGILTIDEERTYYLVYRLTDAFGNTARQVVAIEGKRQPIAPPDTTHAELFHWADINRFGAKGIRLTVPRGCLYTNLWFCYDVQDDSTALAAIHRLHDKPVVLHQSARLSIRLRHDTLTDKRQYGLVRLNKGWNSWIGGTYRDGWMEADIRELGRYTVRRDSLPPAILPLNPASWQKNRRISFRVTDDLSGVSSYRGEIDGAYALFEMNNRSVATYRFDPERLTPGRHTLRFSVTDHCGNESVQEFLFSTN